MQHYAQLARTSRTFFVVSMFLVITTFTPQFANTTYGIDEAPDP